MSSPPSTLGQYQIIREIARSNDIVYEAYDPLMNRRVAVKELSMPGGSTSAQQEDRISRFKREAQAAGTLNHPNIMTVYSFAEDAGRTFMAMEYLDGQSLRNELDTKGSLPTDRAVEIAEAVLSGLSHAHSKGVIHRDIKPDNVQILSNNTVKITDFGIARLTFQPNLTMDGQVFGTPSYMSPEQVVGREIDARSDLFSVGVMLYEMVAGQKPFAGDSVVSITYAIMNNEPSQPQHVGWALWQVIERALSKSPGSRYASADDMKRALEEAVHPVQQPAVDPHYPTGYTASANPYAQPTPPPIPANVNPYMAANQGQVIQTPYNPYSAPGPNANPYAGQYQQPVPTSYPYNPFTNPQGGGAPPHTPGMVAPIYYPPAPRLPVISAEASLFVRKLLLALLVFGTLAAVIVVGLQAFMDMASKADQTQHRLEQGRAEAQQGQEAAQKGNDPDAELHNFNAQGDDPNNPKYAENQGDLYDKHARESNDPNQQARLFFESAEEYKKAADNATGDSKSNLKAQYVTAAINAGNAAKYISDPELIRQVREELQNAGAYASGDSNQASSINDLISQLHA